MPDRFWDSCVGTRCQQAVRASHGDGARPGKINAARGDQHLRGTRHLADGWRPGAGPGWRLPARTRPPSPAEPDQQPHRLLSALMTCMPASAFVLSGRGGRRRQRPAGAVGYLDAHRVAGTRHGELDPARIGVAGSAAAATEACTALVTSSETSRTAVSIRSAGSVRASWPAIQCRARRTVVGAAVNATRLDSNSCPGIGMPPVHAAAR